MLYKRISREHFCKNSFVDDGISPDTQERDYQSCITTAVMFLA
jgi:hypothetical protein